MVNKMLYRIYAILFVLISYSVLYIWIYTLEALRVIRKTTLIRYIEYKFDISVNYLNEHHWLLLFSLTIFVLLFLYYFSKVMYALTGHLPFF